MANKFQKSVLERLEEEKKRQKTQTSSSPKEELPPVAAVEQEPAPDPVAALDPASVETKPAADIPDISAFLRFEPQRSAKNKTFYLDTQVIEAIKSTAKRQKVTDSKLVNDILRRVLGV